MQQMGTQKDSNAWIFQNLGILYALDRHDNYWDYLFTCRFVGQRFHGYGIGIFSSFNFYVGKNPTGSP